MVRTEPGGYDTEQRLKEHSAVRDCPEPSCVAAMEAERVRSNQRRAARYAEGRYERGWESAAAEGLAANAKAQPDAVAWTWEAEAG